MNEADTRAELIDPQLLAAGWKTDTATGVRVRREYQINDGEIRAGGIRTGQLKADYVLEYKNIKLAVVEAKSNELEVSEGVAQAKLYAQKLRIKNSYAANGKEIYEINHDSKTEGIVASFPSPEELWQRTFKETNEWSDRFNAVPFEDKNGTMQARYYQELAVNHVVHAIADNKDRLLLTLATGTGKTFIAFQIAWKLFKSRWTLQRDAKRQPRILFLADRNILANQAFLDFSAFEEDALVRINPKDIAKTGEVPKNGSIFFTIFQTFMSGEKSEPYFGQYEKDFFDLVIIDECHRGGANDESNWREILKHFSSAVHLGLTATPKRTTNTDTYKYFGDPVFIYSLKEGIKDGFLTPFKVKRIQTTIDEYQYTSDDEIIEGEVAEGRVYKEQDFNRLIEIKDRERKRVQELLAAIDHDEKTLVFCATQRHAAMIREFINQEVDDKPVDYCVRVTAKDAAIGEMYLKQFQDNEKLIPTILTTSRKLSTGVNARNVRNVVLLRPVNNMIEFKQIIGRGTRLFEGKYYFTIIDFVNAYQMFNDNGWDGPPTEPPITIGGGVTTPPTPPRPRPPGPTPVEKVRIKLSDGKVREIQSMTSTYFCVDGKPISAEEFLKRLFDKIKLPQLLGSEAELRRVWANPMTRKDLLEKLEREGCPVDDLRKLQELINAKNSDLFDVLEYIAYAKKPVTRELRVETNRSNILNLLNQNQREFVEYVLRNYVEVGVDELDISKLSTVLTAKYGSINAAQEQLGSVQDIQKMFIDFQQYLYKEIAA
ncbi:EcoAI/FtnUII family type I restriction enzme subunit R [Prochlorococcus sp. MIT 1011]|uniref:EcoAI/FtnUII family type I restriction enzme subunit R n=1 Tax=Prochlorococcus sp. MIT 1011 TaxID=3082520 RepID=UPI0039B379E6